MSTAGTGTGKVSSKRVAISSTQDSDYNVLLEHLRGCLAQEGPLFTTDAEGLYDAFLAEIPARHRARYVCRACKSFINKVASTVRIDETGSLFSPFWSTWDPTPAFFAPAIETVYSLAVRSKVTGVYLNRASTWGLAETSIGRRGQQWDHMHCLAGAASRKLDGLHTDEQLMAEKREDFETLSRALAEYPLDLAQKAHSILASLYRGDKTAGAAKWFLDLQSSRVGLVGSRKANLTWRAVATAPPGFCHIKSTMLGTLLEGLREGKDFSEVKRAFEEKMNPAQYQRPTAPPRAGQLAAAEKVVEKLASAGSLRRRFARLEDIADDALWLAEAARPFRKKPAPQGVFGHLHPRSRSERVMDVGTQTMTFQKFWREVLPEAESIEALVPTGQAGFFAFTTAVDLSAPPILQWDRDDARNPVAWYLYIGGSPAWRWRLQAQTWTKVNAITTQPSSWGGGNEHQGQGAYFVLDGAREESSNCLGLFPETLRAEYHGIRAAIEAYSSSVRLEDAHLASACGLAFQKGEKSWSCKLRVTSKGARGVYLLDRWD